MEFFIEKDFHYKGFSIWKKEGTSVSPVVILRKPKSVSEEDYKDFVKRIEISYKL
jgi:hypothetical protein